MRCLKFFMKRSVRDPDKMKTVAHILSYYPGREGLTSFCRGLGLAFKTRGDWSVPVITFRGKPARNLETRHPPLIKFPHRRRHPFDLPSSFFKALDTGELQLDGVVLHGAFSPQVFSLARALRKRGIPYLFVPHDPYVDELVKHLAFRKWAYWHLCEKWVLRNAAAVQLLSASHEAPLRKLGVKTSTFVVANGCDPSELEHLPDKARVPGQERDFRIQYLGRMDRNHKGLDLLIEGFGLFSKELSEEVSVKLILSGNDWHDRRFLEDLAESLGLGRRVEFTGRLADHSIAIQARADLCVLASRFDGFGLTLVEAMLAGRPVLVSSSAGIAEQVVKADSGFVVEPEAESIAKGLAKAWAQRGLLAEMGERGRQYVTNHLTWQDAADRSSEVYQEIFIKRQGD